MMMNYNEMMIKDDVLMIEFIALCCVCSFVVGTVALG